MMVLILWATVRMVLSVKAVLMVVWMRASVSRSTAAVASSRTRIRDFLSRALARQTSCLWPTLELKVNVYCTAQIVALPRHHDRGKDEGFSFHRNHYWGIVKDQDPSSAELSPGKLVAHGDNMCFKVIPSSQKITLIYQWFLHSICFHTDFRTTMFEPVIVSFQSEY